MRADPAALDRRALAALLAGGVLGALARAALGTTEALGAPSGAWPWTRFAVNLAGALLLGALLAGGRRPLAGVAFCGAFTTFSTMQLELVHLLDRGEGALAAGYASASVAGGLLAVSAGAALARGPRARR